MVNPNNKVKSGFKRPLEIFDAIVNQLSFWLCTLIEETDKIKAIKKKICFNLIIKYEV